MEATMTESNTLGRLDIKAILDLIPHRYPFVMIDRILSLELGKNIVGLKNVSMGEPFFQGHFPAHPIMPGVLILEGLAQVGCVLAYLSSPEASSRRLAFFAGIDRARFRKPVIPGDQLIYKLNILKVKRAIVVMDAKAYVDEALVAEAELMASFS
jgi:3-hydroxyacyl-[acyl-carrier-protein] dehydratase